MGDERKTRQRIDYGIRNRTNPSVYRRVLVQDSKLSQSRSIQFRLLAYKFSSGAAASPFVTLLLRSSREVIQANLIDIDSRRYTEAAKLTDSVPVNERFSMKTARRESKKKDRQRRPRTKDGPGYNFIYSFDSGGNRMNRYTVLR